MKSRPVYGRLEPVPLAKRHMAVADQHGLVPLERAFGGSRLPLTVVLAGGPDLANRARAIGADALHLLPTPATALIRLEGLLQTATMGTRLYVAGSEAFVGQVLAAALDHGMSADAIQAEAVAPARRVQCVHCKGLTSDVDASPVRCSHCGLTLNVRDHYSRRIGAFMGVCVDAESPGDVPPPQAFQA